MNHIHDHGSDAPSATGATALDQLFRLTVTLADAMQEDLAQRGLTRARATVLSQLHLRAPMKQRDLAAALRVSARNVTALLEALAPSGLVARAPHPTDGRATLVSLTDQGRRIADRLQSDQHELARFLFADVADDDLAGFTRTIEHILRRLDGPDFARLRQAALERWPSPQP